jgi:thioredoxin-related protein
MRSNNLTLLVILILLLLLIGVVLKLKAGNLRTGSNYTAADFGLILNFSNSATVLVFTSTFCSECRTAKASVRDVVKDFKDITYVEVDAESNLELVRRVDIRSTPTTIFLDSKGFEIARAKGAPKRDQLIKAIKAI